MGEIPTLPHHDKDSNIQADTEAPTFKESADFSLPVIAAKSKEPFYSQGVVSAKARLTDYRCQVRSTLKTHLKELIKVGRLGALSRELSKFNLEINSQGKKILAWQESPSYTGCLDRFTVC